jgi:hypothetical protein
MKMCWPICTALEPSEFRRCDKHTSHEIRATTVAATDITVTPFPSVGLTCNDTTSHDFAQESQSRGSDRSCCSDEALKRPSLDTPPSTSSHRHPPEHGLGSSFNTSPDVSCDVSCLGTPVVQHSTRTPARQSMGIPTRLQTTATSATIRIAPVYSTPPRASTNLSTTQRRIRAVSGTRRDPGTSHVA